MNRTLLAGAIALCVALLTGCGGYAASSEVFRRSMTAGQPEQALAAVNQALDVPKAEDLPKKTGGDNTLLLLERATILQALGRTDLSSRDFETADKNLEVVDFTSDTAGDIGKWVFSDDSGVYRTPPYEKLLVNTLNLLNYLVRGNANGAKVEARRFQINQKYFKESDAAQQGLMALGSYLAGFAFEVAGDAQVAMRYYADAVTTGRVPTALDAAARLHARTGQSDERIAGELAALPPPAPRDETQAELLVVVQIGMAPFKTAERLPIGAAVVAATAPGPGARLTPAQRSQANTFAAKGLLKWVNYPKLRRSAKSRWTSAQVVLDEQQVLSGGEALDIESRAVSSFDQIEGTIVAAAIVRMITRAVAGEATNAVARKASNSGAIGLLAGLLVEGAMTAVDTPDTRSWVTLPARIHVARARISPGRHTVQVRLGGYTRTATLEATPGGWHVLNFSDLR